MANDGPGRARALLVTLRRLNTHAAWCSNYAFEDVIRSVDEADMIELEPAPHFELRQHVARSIAWRSRYRAFQGLNPGVKRAKLTRDYDVLVFVCMNVWDLLYLNAVVDWQSRCRVKLCYLTEFYVGQAPELQHLLRRLRDFDWIFSSCAGSVGEIGKIVGKPCQHLPYAVDVLRFTPYPKPPARVIDVFSIGRRCEPVHQALRRLAAARDFFYLYDTLPSALVRPSSPVEHREMLASAARVSRFFITYPAKFGDDEPHGQSEVGARYFEGAAAGAVLLGQAPGTLAFHREFPWRDAVVELKADGSDVASVLADLSRHPDDLARLGVRNAVAALRWHDWAHRWSAILETIGVAPRPALDERLRALEALAAGAETDSPGHEAHPSRQHGRIPREPATK
ncbi:MAG: glycosyltransferase [Burkholderiales bacterium]